MTGNEIKQRYHMVTDSLKDGVRLVAISKYHPAEHIMAAYNEGQRIFGESHVQELERKVKELPNDIEWHFIGHLQTNKVKYIAPYISMIEAVDSIRLMKEIDKQAAKHNRTIDILLELHIAKEATKYGFSLDECREILNEGEWRSMTHIRICGLMMMASNTDNEEQIRSEFNQAADFFEEVRTMFFKDEPSFSCRSWGMSHDYHIACQCRSNMVRIGTSIFGERVY